MTVHLTAKSIDGTLLFHDWTEALALWRRSLHAFPEAKAACLMPNHPHVLADPECARERMSGVMSGYARWRAHRRGGDTACWQAQPAVEVLADADHLRRMERDVVLNPCRGELTRAPLAWPLSMHRDLVGLGDPRVRRRDPESFHAYVSADPSVSVVGTSLPALCTGPASFAAIEAAVGAVLRLLPAEVTRSPDSRRLCARAAWFREHRDAATLAAWLGTSRARIHRLVAEPPAASRLETEPLLLAVLRVVGDRRFAALTPPRGNPTRWGGWRIRA